MTDTLRLLYAEDNPQDADLTQAHFARAAPDFRLDVVESGARCLERLAAGNYDLLLLDNRLPDMDGLDLLARLRAEGQRLPVVMVTGVGDDETVARALRAGAADYVPKAGDYLATLPEILRGLVARERSRRPLDAAGARQVRRILHVEPNQMDVELTREDFAASAPHLALQAVSDAHQALALLAQAHEFELVLTDLRMPGMNALEFIREARHRGIELPFIVITGRGDENTAVAILRLGAYDYIVKRENYLTQLPHAIDHALERFGLDQTARRLHAELATLNASLEQKVAARTADLRDSEARFRAIIEASPVAMAVNDEHGSLTLLNPKFVETFGYTLADIPNMAAWRPLAYPAPDYRQRVEREWQAAVDKATLEGPELEPMEHSVACKDGTVRYIRFSMAPLGSSNLVIFYDLSERKRDEQKIRAQLDELLRWQTVTLGRETRVLELKAEINQLLAAQGQPPRYADSDSP